MKVGLLNNVNVDLLYTADEGTLRSALDRARSSTSDAVALTMIGDAIDMAVSSGGEIWIDGHRDAVEAFSQLLSLEKPPRRAIGGNAGICAVSLATMGVSAVLSSTIRDDELGRWLGSELSRYGVDTCFVERRRGREVRQATTFGMEVPGHDRCFLADGGDNRSINLQSGFVEASGDLDALLLLGAHNIRGDLFRLVEFVEGMDCLVVTDAGDMRNVDRDQLAGLYALADVACFNEAELGQVYGRSCATEAELEAAARELSESWGNAICVHTERGSMCVLGDDVLVANSFEPRVVGTVTGLGDAFIAGLALGLLEGEDLADGIQNGLQLGNASAAARMETGEPATYEQVWSMLDR